MKYDYSERGSQMKSVEILRRVCVLCAAAGAVFLSAPANAGHTHWSINIGVPVVAAPPPVVAYSGPVVPVAAVVSPSPVFVHPHVAPHPVVVHHPVPHWEGRPGYRGGHGHRVHR